MWDYLTIFVSNIPLLSLHCFSHVIVMFQQPQHVTVLTHAWFACTRLMYLSLQFLLMTSIHLLPISTVNQYT